MTTNIKLQSIISYNTYYNYKANWGVIKSATKFNKNQQYYFIKNLKADGGTPTRETLKYALKNYPTLTDIVLLSDNLIIDFYKSAKNLKDYFGALGPRFDNVNEKYILTMVYI